MKFICLIHVDRAKMAAMTEADRVALDKESREGDAKLLESGHLIAAGPLAEPETAVLLRNVKGKLSVTDGAYAETKEHMGGFVLIEAANREEAIELLAGAEMAKYATLEIREHWPLVDYMAKGQGQ